MLPAHPPGPGRRPAGLSVLTVLATLAASLSAWCSLGAVTPAGPGPGAPRVGLLPAWWILAGLAALALAVSWRARLPARQALPLFASLVLVLPWLPVPVPAAFLIWTGPIAWWVWAAIAVAMAWPTARPSRSPTRQAILSGVLAFAMFLGLAWQARDRFPAGDEPHYLIITQSLLLDADLRIENNHARGDYRTYFTRFPLDKPDFLQRGRDGSIYSIHAPGLPVVIAPAFALAGYPGVVVFLALLAALAAALTWWTGYRVTGDTGAAWMGWAALAWSSPFAFHAFAVYPEVAASLIVTAGVLVLAVAGTRAGGGGRQPVTAAWLESGWGAFLQGGALAVLPWLHTRYAVIAASLGLVLLLRILAGPDRWRRAALFLVLPAVGAAAWFGFFQAIYGTFSPAAPYGRSRQSRLEYIPVAFPAILFDQQFGLVPNAPVYAFGLIGLLALAWRRPRLAAELALVVLSYLLTAATFRMWWGGLSAPARFTVPVVPVLGVGVAVLWARAGQATRALVAASLVATALVTLTLALAEEGGLIFNDRDGFCRWLEYLAPAVDLPRAAGSFIRGRPEPALLEMGAWAAACGAAWLGLAGLSRRRRLDLPVLAFLTLAAVAAAIMASASLVWAMTGSQGVDATPAQVRLLRASGRPTAATGVAFQPLGLISPLAVARRLAIASSGRRPRARDDVSLLFVAGIPPGTYRVEADMGSRDAGTLQVGLARDFRPIHTCRVEDAAGHSGGCVFSLPVEAAGLTVLGDDIAREAVARVTLRPMAIDATAARSGAAPAAARAARYGATVWFFTDDFAWIEDAGCWVKGGETSTVVFAAASAPEPAPRSILIRVRNGAAANRVRLVSGSWQAEFDLQAREAREVGIPLEAGRQAATVSIRSDAGFRPIEFEPGSQDERYLGCWLEAGR